MTRTSILNIAATIFASILPFTAAPAMHAQSPRNVAVVKVPFAFEAGTKHLQAGTYTISLVGENTMILRGNANHDGAIGLVRWTEDAQAGKSSKVVFHHYGDKYFLREVWDAGESHHLENIQTSAEARLRKSRSLNVASNGSIAPAVEVVVAASQN